MTDRRDRRGARIIGVAALGFSMLYLASDAVEAIHGEFTRGQLWLTLIAEAAVPVFVIGLYLIQRPQIGRLGQLSAVAYAYSFVYFTGTVVYALNHAITDYSVLSQQLQPWMTVHGVIMLIAGLGFGGAVIRAGVLPRWTAIALMTGVVLVSLSQDQPAGLQLLAAAIRDLGFAGMGAALLGGWSQRSVRTPTPGASESPTPSSSGTAAVTLYWIPLGAGGHFVRFNGRVFEAIAAARRHRDRCDLYHAALVAEVDGDRYSIELAPSPDADEASRGVVATGAVGSRYLGRLRVFRYEVRCWRGGSIPDLGEAVGAPCRLTDDPLIARRLIDLVATVPRPVWGRDELKAGEMWNSNSLIAWLIAASDLLTDDIGPPPRGRAPGWDPGLIVAQRSVAKVRATAEAHEARSA